MTPGLDFDPERGHKTLRFSYARSTEDIREGLRRLQDFMALRKKIEKTLLFENLRASVWFLKQPQ